MSESGENAAQKTPQANQTLADLWRREALAAIDFELDHQRKGAAIHGATSWVVLASLAVLVWTLLSADWLQSTRVNAVTVLCLAGFGIVDLVSWIIVVSDSSSGEKGRSPRFDRLVNYMAKSRPVIVILVMRNAALAAILVGQTSTIQPWVLWPSLFWTIIVGMVMTWTIPMSYRRHLARLDKFRLRGLSYREKIGTSVSFAFSLYIVASATLEAVRFDKASAIEFRAAILLTAIFILTVLLLSTLGVRDTLSELAALRRDVTYGTVDSINAMRECERLVRGLDTHGLICTEKPQIERLLADLVQTADRIVLTVNALEGQAAKPGGVLGDEVVLVRNSLHTLLPSFHEFQQRLARFRKAFSQYSIDLRSLSIQGGESGTIIIELQQIQERENAVVAQVDLASHRARSVAELLGPMCL